MSDGVAAAPKAPHKKTTKKSRKPTHKTARKTNGGGKLAIGGFVEAGKIAVIPNRTPSKEYQPIIDKLKALKPGMAFEVTPPKGVSVATMQNRLSAVVKRAKVTVPSGYRIAKSTSTTGTVVISLVKA